LSENLKLLYLLPKEIVCVLNSTLHLHFNKKIFLWFFLWALPSLCTKKKKFRSNTSFFLLNWYHQNS